MAKEYKTFLVVTSEKTRSPTTTTYDNGQSPFFTTYRNALSISPANWFRLRDCDALCRFTIVAALRCNGFEIDGDGEEAFWFTEEQWRILAEIGVLMYDSVAFYKHRAEGETNNTFAYLDEELRTEMFRGAREGLWAIDRAFTSPVASMGTEDGMDRVQREKEKARAWMVVCNMLRFFGGPIHVTMRRYRFVEEELRIGREEDENVRGLARRNEKLWWRREDEGGKDEVGLTKDGESIEMVSGRNRFEKYMEKKGELFSDGFMEMMQERKSRDGNVAGCGAGEGGKIDGSVCGARILSEAEREVWRQYALGFNDRLKRAFPEVDLDPALPV